MNNASPKMKKTKVRRASAYEKWEAVMEAKLALELLKFEKMGDKLYAQELPKVQDVKKAKKKELKQAPKIEKVNKGNKKEQAAKLEKENKKEKVAKLEKTNKENKKEEKIDQIKYKKHFTNTSREALHGYFFILLWIIGVCIFTLWPIIQAFYYSFCEATFKGSGIVSEFRWFDNFIYAFSGDAKFPTMLRSYLLEIVIQVPFALTIALLISMMLNQKIKLRGLWRLIFFLPVIIISGPVISELISQGTTSINISGGAIGNFITNTLPPFLSNIIVLLFDKLIIVLWYTGIPILARG